MLIAMNEKAMYNVLGDLDTFITKSAKVQQAIIEDKNGIEYAEMFHDAEYLSQQIIDFCDNALRGYVCFKPTTRDLANIRELKKSLTALREATTKYVLLRMLAPLRPEIKLSGDDIVSSLTKVRQVAYAL
ncbi:MAG: hypothetical protein GY861_13840 [bacterium]|nr:hypothetical protein [bacterium]